MPMWRRNLFVCWFGFFVASVGMSQIAPIMPLFIRRLGVEGPALIAQFSGIAFGITFIISAIFSPIWGHAADRFGRKPMLLRASLGMAVVVFSMGFAPNVYVLIALRLAQGAITGYSTACTTLIATQTDKEHAGWALGTLSTGNITGSLLGPMIGGYIGDKLGLQNVFFMTGALLLISFRQYPDKEDHAGRSHGQSLRLQHVGRLPRRIRRLGPGRAGGGLAGHPIRLLHHERAAHAECFLGLFQSVQETRFHRSEINEERIVNSSSSGRPRSPGACRIPFGSKADR